MRVVVYSGYGQADEMQRTYADPASQLAPTTTARHESPISVIGVTLAFFSTLIIFAHMMATGGQR